MKRFWLLHFVLGLQTVLLAGCGGAGSGGREALTEEQLAAAAQADPSPGDWLMLRLPAEPPHLNPLTSTDAYATEVTANILDTLLDRHPETLEMEPNLAESWEVSEDHLVYTFHLREGVTFSDGEALTAQDVKFTYDTLMDPTVDALALRSYFEDVVSCEVLDDYTVRFTCDEPYYRHLVMLGGLEILPEHIYGEGDFNTHPNNRMPIGSGRYVLDEWETNREIVLARNENYWGLDHGKPVYFDRVVYRIILDENVAFQMLSRGELDMLAVRPEDWVRRADNPEFDSLFNKHTYYRPAYTYIGWNLRLDKFNDQTVRRALTMLLDRPTIRDEIFHGLARIAVGNFMPGTAEYDESLEPWPYDPEAALALLDEAGWSDSNGDGIRDKDGTDLAFEILIGNNNPDGERIATLYQEALGRVGIRMTIRPLEWASLIDRVDKRNFDAVMLGWRMPPDPDPHQVWHSSQVENGSNYVGFKNERADALIEKARVTFDRDERADLYKEFQQILHDEQPYTFLFNNESLLAVDKRIHGITIYPFGPDQREWYVPEMVRRYGGDNPG